MKFFFFFIIFFSFYILSSSYIFSKKINFISKTKLKLKKEDDLNQKYFMKHDLLTANEEFFLARQYRLGEKLTSRLKELEEIEGKNNLNDEIILQNFNLTLNDIQNLIKLSQNAKEKLIFSNMRLVSHLSRFYLNRGLSLDDLFQEGIAGLNKAIEKFDPDKGFRFSTYASWWIKQSISRAIAEKSRLIRLPVHIHDLTVSLYKIEKNYIQEHGEKPTYEELAELLLIPVEDVEMLKRCTSQIGSLDDDPFHSPDSPSASHSTRKDFLVSTSVGPDLRSERMALQGIIFF